MPEGSTIIIGGGVIGVCSAYELVRRGVPVTLVERGELGGAASLGNAGQMAIGHPPIPRPGLALQAMKWMFDPASPLHISPRAGLPMIPWLYSFWRACSPSALKRSMAVLAEMGRLTIPMFDEYIERESIACDYRRAGIMDVYRTEAGARKGMALVELMQQFGMDVVWLTGAEVEAREPAFLPGVTGAVWNRKSTSLDPALFVRGVATGARGLGADLRERSPVRRLVVEKGRVVGVELETGERLEGSNIVLTAGIWSSELCRSARINIPMQAGKGYHRDIVQDEPRLTTPCVLAERFVACTPMSGALRLAGTLEFSGVNQVMRQRRLDALTEGANVYLRGVRGKEPLSEWSGLRPCPADGMPVIGWAPRVLGLCIATGHSMLGMTLGPVTGRLVAEIVTGAPASVDLNTMRADRF